MWSRKERTICRTQALAGALTLSGPRISRDDVEGGALAAGQRLPHLGAELVDLLAGGGDVGVGVAEGATVAGQDEVDVERLDRVEAGEEFADRVGAVAVVEEEDGAAEQVVAGDQQPALGLVEDDVRGGVAGGLVDLPGAVVGLELDPGDEVAVGLADAVDQLLAAALAGLAVALQGRRRDAALARRLEPLLERRGGVVDHQPDVAPARVQPELAAGALDDRRRQPVVVGVRVGAEQQLDVLEAKPGLAQGEVELAHPPLAADPGVDEDDAVAGGQRPGVAVRHPGPGQRQPQPPDPRQGPLGARRLGLLLTRHDGNPLRSPRAARTPA